MYARNTFVQSILIASILCYKEGMKAAEPANTTGKILFRPLKMQPEMGLPLIFCFEGDRNGSGEICVRLWVEILN